MANPFGAVNSVLNNSAVKAGLALAGPHATLMAEGVQALMLTFAGSRQRRHKASEVLSIIDKRAAELIESLSKAKSRRLRAELEIRLHELLEIGQRWDRAT